MDSEFKCLKVMLILWILYVLNDGVDICFFGIAAVCGLSFSAAYVGYVSYLDP